MSYIPTAILTKLTQNYAIWTVTPKCGVYYEYILYHLYLILFFVVLCQMQLLIPSFYVFCNDKQFGEKRYNFFCTCDNHGFAGYFLMVVCWMAFLTSIFSNLDQVILWLIYSMHWFVFPLYPIFQALNLMVVNFVMQCACRFLNCEDLSSQFYL